MSPVILGDLLIGGYTQWFSLSRLQCAPPVTPPTAPWPQGTARKVLNHPALAPNAARAFAKRIDQCMTRDRYRLRQQLRRLDEGRTDPSALESLQANIERSAAVYSTRLAGLPRIQYPEELPVSERKADIAAAIRDHPVVIVCGETGSGKTTQLPKICLDLKRGVAGMIAHTQPRRIAARSVAHRIAAELGTPLGEHVGYKVRFADKVSDQNYVRVMTDGILLAETQGDRFLNAYDTLIIDEAHERSLNIDFLLGYTRQLLEKRRDLKLIITSATIDAERFSQHFGNAPVVEVSGRLYPVDVRYRPISEDEEEEDEELPDAIVTVVEDVSRLSAGGDVLVFLPGEREIRECAEALRKQLKEGTEILPLFARLSADEQERVFKPTGQRRVVLATNVAETSLTVPGIKYVIDSGLARVNRYSYRNKVEMLQIEKISRASANQRAGRCGRVMSGVCVRLYSEEDFALRTEFTDPEILRSSLAGVILRMKLLKLGEPEEFPFVDAPSSKAIADGYQLLSELGAVDDERRLTPVGAQLAKLPVDPRVARMIVAAKEEGCLAEVLIIAAGLAIRDPRERPLEKQEAADSAHAQFMDERSEFLGLLKLWEFFDEALKHRQSNRQLVKLCHDNFLSYVRLREWRELHSQLAALIGEMGWRENEKASRPDEIHRALLAGLLGNIGVKSEDVGVYLGARAIKFSIFPGSALRKKGPPWMMAAELTETTRLYARCVAPVDPAWLEKVGKHLVKRIYLDPHWEKRSAQAIAFERVTLYGLVVVPKRRVSYGPIDPVESRRIFIREALVHGHYELEAPFLSHNLGLRKDVEALEHKSRRHDVLVDDEVVFGFYDERVPADIWSGQQFEKWRREAERKEPKFLFATRDLLMRHAASEINEERFPDNMEINGVRYRLQYRFEPGHALDGVSMLVPLHLLNQVDERRCEWLVPGMLRDKLTHLIKALPKGLRKNFVPVPQYVSNVLNHLQPEARPLCPEIGAALLKVAGVEVPNDAWDESDLPAHHKMNYQVVDDNDHDVAMSRDIAQLRSDLGIKARRQFSESARGQFERSGITSWDFPDLPEQIEFIRDGQRLIGYPAIIDEGKSVALKVLDTEQEADAATHRGLRRLFRLALPDQVKHMARSLPNFQEMSLRYAIMLDLDSGKSDKRGADKGAIADRLRDELVEAICDRAFFVEETPIRTKAAFQERLGKAKTRMHDVTLELCRLANETFTVYQDVRAKLNTPSPQAWQKALNDIRGQIKELVPSGFLARVPLTRLRHIPRYLKAILFRIDKIASNPVKDFQWLQEIARLWQVYKVRVDDNRIRGIHDPRVEEFRWMLEELRVSLWAQQLKTPFPVSFKRLEKYWSEIR